MTNTLFEPTLNAVDVRHLYYFAVVAEENNLRRAAERLFMAQPPLSRHIKQLEERLGVALFARHSKGLTLTDEGARVLEIIQPLLKMKEATYARIREEICSKEKSLRIGFTTAFEQGTFARLETHLLSSYGKGLHILRENSPKLLRDIRKEKLDVALVALPLNEEWASGLAIREMDYTEPMVAALPTAWLEVEKSSKAISLKEYTGKPLFWFRRDTHPVFFDFMKARFTQVGFTPLYLEEPAEHDVLLARIASGEGMGLFATSFAAIKREGVVFAQLMEKDIFHLRLGIASPSGSEDFIQALLDNSAW